MSRLNIAFNRFDSIGTVMHYILVINERERGRFVLNLTLKPKAVKRSKIASILFQSWWRHHKWRHWQS